MDEEISQRQVDDAQTKVTKLLLVSCPGGGLGTTTKLLQNFHIQRGPRQRNYVIQRAPTIASIEVYHQSAIETLHARRLLLIRLGKLNLTASATRIAHA